jgi:hypothetical protein
MTSAWLQENLSASFTETQHRVSPRPNTNGPSWSKVTVSSRAQSFFTAARTTSRAELLLVPFPPKKASRWGLTVERVEMEKK